MHKIVLMMQPIYNFIFFLVYYAVLIVSNLMTVVDKLMKRVVIQCLWEIGCQVLKVEKRNLCLSIKLFRTVTTFDNSLP